MTKTKANIVFFDIETAPIVATTWSLYPDSLSHENILKDWYIICAAWKSLDNKTVDAVAIKTPGNDYELCKQLRVALSKADILVTHNGDKFDIKKFNARLIFHKLPPLPLIPTVDTLKEVKKIAAFTSNRLDYLSKVLIGKGKIKTEYHLWLDVIGGSREAVKKMVAYCKVDVIRLQQIYEVLRPYMKRHPHVGVIEDKDKSFSCNACGSTHVKRNGVRISATGGKKQEIQCQGCGHYGTIPFKI